MRSFLYTAIVLYSLVVPAALQAAIITATPNPATVGVSTTINVRANCSNATPACPMVVNFGDGTSFTFTAPTVSNGGTACISNDYTTPHTYNTPSAGYTITANKPGGGVCGTADSGTLVLAVNCVAPTLTSPSTLPTATVGTPYSYTLTVTGNPGPFTFSPTGSLPAGLSLSSTGTISGTPTAAGTSAFGITVRNACPAGVQTSSGTFSMTVNPPPCVAPAITTASLAAGTAGTAYSSQLSATGSPTPLSFSIAAGTLPAGLSLSTTGLISGTPTASGTFSVTYRVTNSCPAGAQSATRVLNLTINPPPCVAPAFVSPATLASGTVGQPYSQVVPALVTGSPTPITGAVIAGALPDGLSYNGATRLISGTPTTAGVSSFTVQISNSCSPTPQTASQVFSLSINPAPVLCTPLGFGAVSATATVGTPYTAPIISTGGVAPITYALLSGSLPPGLALAGSTISGTPTTPGTYSFTVRASDTCPSAPQNVDAVFTVLVNPAPCPAMTLAPAFLPSATVGQPYTSVIAAIGGQGGVGYTMVGGTLPAGISIAPDGTITGTPGGAGNYSFTVQATDSCATPQTRTASFQLAVTAAALPLTVSASPASFFVARGDSAGRTIAYSFSGSGSTTLSSPGGNFLVGGALLATNPQSLSVAIVSGRGQANEALTIPVAVLERALQGGNNSFLYERVFSDTQGGTTLTVRVPVIIATDARASLELKRLELTFPNGRGETTVSRNYAGLKARATMFYTGTGTLRGFWEVDGRLLSRVEQHLLPVGQVVLETPPIPPIPTFDEGSHILRFVVEEPSSSLGQPSLLYFVTASESAERGVSLKVVSPVDGAIVPFQPVKFAWEPVAKSTVYELSFFLPGEAKQSFGALTRKPSYTLGAAALKGSFHPGRSYTWRVVARDGEGRVVGSGGPWEITFSRNGAK